MLKRTDQYLISLCIIVYAICREISSGKIKNIPIDKVNENRCVYLLSYIRKGAGCKEINHFDKL